MSIRQINNKPTAPCLSNQSKVAPDSFAHSHGQFVGPMLMFWGLDNQQLKCLQLHFTA